MRTHGHIPALTCLSALTFLPLVGCSTPRTGESVTAAPRDAAPSDVSLVASTTDPTDNPKQAAWKAATRGLHFDTGRLVVDPQGPPDADAAFRHYRDGRRFFAENRFVDAIGAYRDALSRWFDSPETIEALGDACHMKGETGWAIACYRTLLDDEPTRADVRFKLATMLWADSQSNDAVAELTRVTELDPARADAHERLAIWHYYLDDPATAWRHVHAARAAGGDVPPQFIPLLSARMADPGAGR